MGLAVAPVARAAAHPPRLALQRPAASPAWPTLRPFPRRSVLYVLPCAGVCAMCEREAIVVTEEMREAGVAILMRFSDSARDFPVPEDSLLVERVFLAMLQARIDKKR